MAELLYFNWLKNRLFYFRDDFAYL
jgi:hypothetical protein